MTHGIKTPLGRVRGLGSAKSGSEHFWLQRMTAVANIFLGVAFVTIVVIAARLPYAEVVSLFGNPLVGLLMILFVVAGTLHMRLGMQVIIEDYIHAEGAKILALMANTFFTIAIAIACVYAVVRVALS